MVDSAGQTVGRLAAVSVAVVPAAAYVVLLLLASPLIALFAGQYSLERAARREEPAAWQSIAVGAAVLAVIGLVPYLNVAVAVLVVLFGFGAWLLFTYRRYTAARAESRV
jgi:O-antigen/teichoic acid export membrane protein